MYDKSQPYFHNLLKHVTHRNAGWRIVECCNLFLYYSQIVHMGNLNRRYYSITRLYLPAVSLGCCVMQHSNLTASFCSPSLNSFLTIKKPKQLEITKHYQASCSLTHSNLKRSQVPWGPCRRSINTWAVVVENHILSRVIFGHNQLRSQCVEVQRVTG